jgi:hypothetical protein
MNLRSDSGIMIADRRSGLLDNRFNEAEIELTCRRLEKG